MKYSGKLGIAEQIEVSSGVWDERITEHDIFGDLLQTTEALGTGDDIIPRMSTTTSVSVLAWSIGVMELASIRYLTHLGKRWTISSYVFQPPRVVLYFGEEYHGAPPN